MGNRGVNFQRFKGFITLFLLGHSVNRAHIMQSVRQLNNNNPYILTHRYEHFSKAFRLLLLLGGEIKSSYLCNPVHKQCHIVAEVPFYVLNRGVGILYNIVQKCCGYRFAVHSEGNDNKRHIKGMDIVILIGAPFLPLML